MKVVMKVVSKAMKVVSKIAKGKRSRAAVLSGSTKTKDIIAQMKASK